MDTRGSSVFSCLGVIVVEIWGAARNVNCVSEEGDVKENLQDILGARHDCGIRASARIDVDFWGRF